MGILIPNGVLEKENIQALIIGMLSSILPVQYKLMAIRWLLEVTLMSIQAAILKIGHCRLSYSILMIGQPLPPLPMIAGWKGKN